MNMKQGLWRLAFVLCLAVFLVSGALFWKERSRRLAFEGYMAALQSAVAAELPEQGGATEQGNASLAPAASGQESRPPAPSSVPEPEQRESAPIAIDFEALAQINGDVVGWLYGEDTPIHYPVVQGSDNDRYLKRLLDGKYDSAGSLFMDYRNDSSFSDWNTLIYGHNMKDETMFGSLDRYQEQAYYEAHPSLYLLTPEGDYRIELLGGFLTDAASWLYEPGPDAGGGGGAGAGGGGKIHLSPESELGRRSPPDYPFHLLLCL